MPKQVPSSPAFRPAQTARRHRRGNAVIGQGKAAGISSCNFPRAFKNKKGILHSKMPLEHADGEGLCRGGRVRQLRQGLEGNILLHLPDASGMANEHGVIAVDCGKHPYISHCLEHEPSHFIMSQYSCSFDRFQCFFAQPLQTFYKNLRKAHRWRKTHFVRLREGFLQKSKNVRIGKRSQGSCLCEVKRIGTDESMRNRTLGMPYNYPGIFQNLPVLALAGMHPLDMEGRSICVKKSRSGISTCVEANVGGNAQESDLP
ncbi:MAG: hypothetical protein J5855_07575 [Mailhella sp.]|nr:hypothetical protein [Mailhella sp.]